MKKTLVIFITNLGQSDRPKPLQNYTFRTTRLSIVHEHTTIFYSGQKIYDTKHSIKLLAIPDNAIQITPSNDIHNTSRQEIRHKALAQLKHTTEHAANTKQCTASSDTHTIKYTT